MRKPTPSSLLGQKLAKQIAGTRRRQKQQQEHTVKLGRTPFLAPPCSAVPRQQLIEMIIGHKRGQSFQQGLASSDG
jgi:hypothetical protein